MRGEATALGDGNPRSSSADGGAPLELHASLGGVEAELPRQEDELELSWVMEPGETKQ
jgi:hypothetical protein